MLKNTASNWLLALVCLACLSFKNTGCGKAALSDTPSPATEQRSASFLLKKLSAQKRDKITLMHAQGKVYAEGNGQSIGATYNLVWVRDSLVWLNVKKFGLEAVRALVTRDSVFVLNRLEKTYSAKSIESLQRQYSLPAGFELLQSLLLAEPWLIAGLSLESEVKDGLHRLSGANGRYAADYRIEEGSYRLRQESFLQPKDARKVSVSFDKHKKNELTGWFPYLRTIEAFSPDLGDVRFSIEFNDVAFNVPKSFRFEIPSHYERVD